MRSSSRELAEQAWIEVADRIDLQLSPLGLAALDALDPRAGQTILDIGCGAGQTLRQLAHRVGPTGRVIGVDIAPRLLELARSRTVDLAHVQLVHGDAAALALPDALADGVFSRFGLMALEDSLAAFRGFRRLTRRGGRLGFVCWRSLQENELDLLPLRAAELEHAIDATPFKFERSDYVREVLQAAGFEQIEIEARDTAVSSGDLDAMTSVLTKVGPLGRILRENPALRARAEPRVRARLADRASGSGEIALRAATWVVTATAG